MPLPQNTIDDLVKVATRQLRAGIAYKQPRMTQIGKNEDLYSEKPKPTLPGRFSLPIDSVIVQGFVQTFLSKVDNPPKIYFEAQRSQDLFSAKKNTAAWDIDSAPDKGDWGGKDLAAKKLALLGGRTFYKYYADSSGKEYKSVLEVPDYYDMVVEPNGGGLSLDNHLFVAQMNIFKSRKELEDGIDGGYYDKLGVRKLIVSHLSPETKKTDTSQFNNKVRRLQTLGLDPASNNYVGEEVFVLTEQCLTYKGERYYLLYDHEKGVAVRAEKLKDIFESNLYPWVSWATDIEPFNFWSKSPVDSLRPIAEAARIIFNQSLDNMQKRNWDRVAYDKNIFPNPEQFKYAPDRLIRANVPPGGSISQGLYHFETPNTLNQAMELMDWIQGFTGLNLGVTPSAKGVSDEDKVGIYYGNLEQVADRFGLTNKLYSKAWIGLGTRYSWGLYEHLPQDMMVKYIGLNGAEWTTLSNKDVEPDFGIRITAGNAEAVVSEIKSKKQQAALTNAINAGFLTDMNKKVTLEAILRGGEFEEDQVKSLTDANSDGTQEMASKADSAIADILDNKEPRKYRGADTYFIQRIIDFAYDADLGKDEAKALRTYERLMTYALDHLPFAQENIIRKAMATRSKMGMGVEGAGEALSEGGGPSRKISPEMPSGLSNEMVSNVGTETLQNASAQ